MAWQGGRGEDRYDVVALTSAGPKPHVGTTSYPECVVVSTHTPGIRQALPSPLTQHTLDLSIVAEFLEAKATCPSCI